MPVDPAGTSVWDTFPVSRVVLMACRSLTSTIRLLEVHRLFRDDVRLRFLFAVDNGSRFGAASARHLQLAGVPDVVDWAGAGDLMPDLTLAANENVDPASVRGKVIVLPHGVGFNKFVPTADGAGRRVAGVPGPAALRSGRLRLALSHPDQARQLRAVCADIAGRTVVTGDPTLDQLTTSLPLRGRYRELLDASARRLVLISSTWGRESAIGRWWTLPTELLAALPADDYRVCLALHPNVWARYGALGVESYLATALDAGLVLLPPEAGWHAAMIASDVVVADHGSLSLYAAALGKRLLLTDNADTITEIVPDTPMTALLDAADRLDRRAPLAAQIQAAEARAPLLGGIADQAFAHRGEAVGRLRRTLYEALDLDPPENAHQPRVADPAATRRGPWSFRVSTSTGADVMTLTRYPAAAAPDAPGHLVVTDDETDLRLHERAAVVCRDRPTAHTHALTWARNALTTHPGARMAAAGVPGGCLVVTRDGPEVLLTSDVPADVPALGSLAYARLLTGGLGDDVVSMVVGARTTTVRITPGPAR